MPPLTDHIRAVRDNVEKVILGKANVVRLAVVGLLARGHILIEDVPGVGKTTLARALAGSIGASFQRVQFTPDLLPSDILGVSVFDEGSGQFHFRPGPVFANIVLADEINRTTPRTQASLLEAMNDRQVTIDGATRPLPPLFMVIATQNPLEYAGTYPLPESQLDRFFLRLTLGYPERASERRLLAEHGDGRPPVEIRPVVSLDDVLTLQRAVERVHVDPTLVEYVIAIADATRHSPALRGGASPRASLALHRAAQSSALVDGRDFALPDDVKSLAAPVLAHRLRPRGAPGDGMAAVEGILAEILRKIPPPA